MEEKLTILQIEFFQLRKGSSFFPYLPNLVPDRSFYSTLLTCVFRQRSLFFQGLNKDTKCQVLTHN